MEALLNFIKLIADFIGMLFNGVMTLLNFLPSVVSSITATFAYLPDFIAPFMVLSMSLTMLFAIIRLL